MENIKMVNQTIGRKYLVLITLIHKVFAFQIKKITDLGSRQKWTSQNLNLAFFHLIKEPIKNMFFRKIIIPVSPDTPDIEFYKTHANKNTIVHKILCFSAIWSDMRVSHIS